MSEAIGSITDRQDVYPRQSVMYYRSTGHLSSGCEAKESNCFDFFSTDPYDVKTSKVGTIPSTIHVWIVVENDAKNRVLSIDQDLFFGLYYTDSSSYQSVMVLPTDKDTFPKNANLTIDGGLILGLCPSQSVMVLPIDWAFVQANR